MKNLVLAPVFALASATAFAGFGEPQLPAQGIYEGMIESVRHFANEVCGLPGTHSSCTLFQCKVSARYRYDERAIRLENIKADECLVQTATGLEWHKNGSEFHQFLLNPLWYRDSQGDPYEVEITNRPDQDLIVLPESSNYNPTGIPFFGEAHSAKIVVDRLEKGGFKLSFESYMLEGGSISLIRKAKGELRWVRAD